MLSEYYKEFLRLLRRKNALPILGELYDTLLRDE